MINKIGTQEQAFLPGGKRSFFQKYRVSLKIWGFQKVSFSGFVFYTNVSKSGCTLACILYIDH